MSGMSHAIAVTKAGTPSENPSKEVTAVRFASRPHRLPTIGSAVKA